MIETIEGTIITNILDFGMVGVFIIGAGWFFKKWLTQKMKSDAEQTAKMIEGQQKHQDLIVQLMEENKQDNEATQLDFTNYLKEMNVKYVDIIAQNTSALDRFGEVYENLKA